MPENIEVETDKLQEQIAEEHERHGQEAGWLRYAGLAAAIFAVFAAMSALRAGDLINEAMISQIKASDTWAEYQASRQKEHIYTVAADNLSDRGSKNTALVGSYRGQIAKEAGKEKSLSEKARKLEEESATGVGRHHSFEYAVALLQVGIALSAVAALARYKPTWYVSLAVGAVGIAFFVLGFAR